jgi:glycosyltransferase involved in cell wall biosynthesis
MKYYTLKTIAIIGSAGIPARYGGFETLAQNLVLKLCSRFRFIVYCSKRLYSKHERMKPDNYADLVYIPLNSNGFQSIIYDIMAIIHAVRKADILLILGVSGCLILPFIKLFSGKKIITHIDGLEWKRDKWNYFTRLFLKLSELMAIKFSDEIIADNKAIKEYISKKHSYRPNLIEYGGDHSLEVSDSTDLKSCFKDLRYPYALTVSRIEPENNIHTILYAFSCVPSKHIVVVGNWNNNRYSRRLYKKYVHYDNILLYDSVYEPGLLNLLRSGCEVYIHGNSSGGTNPSLVEAMYAGKPVIAYDVIYNRITTMDKAVYFKGQEELVKILKEVNTSELKKNKINMGKIARTRYNWTKVCEKYAGLFI